MKKIIAKYKIKNREEFEDKLAEKGLDFSPIRWLHDRVYTPRGYRPHQNYPRLIMRTTMYSIDESPTYSFLLRRHIEDSGIDIIERTPVEDYIATARIALQLGFTQSGEVSRRRQDLQYNENTAIYLDELDGRPEGAATYAKIERLLDDAASATAAREELIEIMKNLGETDLTEQPYCEM